MKGEKIRQLIHKTLSEKRIVQMMMLWSCCRRVGEGGGLPKRGGGGGIERVAFIAAVVVGATGKIPPSFPLPIVRLR